MAIVHWEPIREIDSLHREMNRLLDDVFIPVARRNNNGFGYGPAVELEETDNALELRLEIPGMNGDDLDIQVTAEAVSISGERRTETKTEQKGVFQTEFRYGKFQRVIPLPMRINNRTVTANYTDGILHLTLPKAEDELNKVVKVSLS